MEIEELDKRRTWSMAAMEAESEEELWESFMGVADREIGLKEEVD